MVGYRGDKGVGLQGKEVRLSKICALPLNEVGVVENTLKPDLMAAGAKTEQMHPGDLDIFSLARVS